MFRASAGEGRGFDDCGTPDASRDRHHTIRDASLRSPLLPAPGPLGRGQTSDIRDPPNNRDRRPRAGRDTIGRAPDRVCGISPRIGLDPGRRVAGGRRGTLPSPSPLVQKPTDAPLTRFITFATMLLVVMILRVGEDVVIPIALSVLLAFLLSPCVNRLARWGLPDALAVCLTATLGFAVLGGLGWIVGTQAVSVLEELPRHEENIRAKISSLKHLQQKPGSLSRTTGLVESLQEEVSAAPSEAAGARDERKARAPVPVMITEAETRPTEFLRQMLAPALEPLGTGGIVIVFVVAILFQREDLRDRFIKLISGGRMNTATQAVNDAARRVSRYLGMQLLVNAAYGIPVGVGLYIIGIPGAVLWGLLATVLRFIPFLGPWIAAAFPLALAVAVDPGWTKLLYTAALFITLELISNNVIEVLVYGASTGISSFALLVAAVFWTWLWGTAGLFLSTPLTVCLLVMGKYVPGLKFLSVLLGSDPALAPPTLFYQRMLLMSFDEMHELARKYVGERSLVAFYDDIFIPALILAEEDRHNGDLAEVRQRFIIQAGRELIEELSPDADEAGEATAGSEPPGAGPIHILGIPARDEADELVALMVQHVLRSRGIHAEVSAITRSPAENAAMIARHGIATTFISALPPSALVAARQACRRLKAECGGARVLVGVWSREARARDLKPRFRGAMPDEVATSLGEAVAFLENAARMPATNTPAGDAGASAAEARTTEPLSREEAAGEVYERVRRGLAQAFEVPVSLIKIVDCDRGFWSAAPWFPSEADVARDALRETAIASAVDPASDLVLVEDIRKDKRFSDNRVLIERGVNYLAGVPLRGRDGRVVGILCVIDTKARSTAEHQMKALQSHAAELMAALETKPAEIPADHTEGPARPPRSGSLPG